MDYRGMPIEYGGWLELLLLTVPVAAFLTIRRIVKGKKFTIGDVGEGVFLSYMTIMMLLMVGVALYGVAIFITAPFVFVWGLYSGEEVRELMKTPEARMFLVMVWTVLAVIAVRWYRKRDD